MIRAVLVLLPVALLLTACGYSPDSTDNPKHTTVNYLGQELHCLHFEGKGQGSWSGVSCDFVRFHNEN